MHKKFFVVLVLLVVILGTTAPAFAEETPTGTTAPSVTIINQARGTQREKLQQRETELRALRDKKLQEFKDKLDKKESELKDKIASREAQLKDKLAAFKDKKKAQTAENVSSRLTLINKKRVEQMTRNVNVFDDILTKVKTRTAAAKTEGKDVLSIESEITKADLAIATARAAITTQAGKDYTLTATDETKIHEEAKAKRDLLASDLKTTYETIKLARVAVRKAIQAAYNGIGKGNVDITETPRATGTITVTPSVSVSITPATTTVPTNTTTPQPTATPTI